MHEEAKDAINNKKGAGAVRYVGFTAGGLRENDWHRDGGRRPHGKFCGAVTAEGDGFAFDRWKFSGEITEAGKMWSVADYVEGFLPRAEGRTPGICLRASDGAS